MIHSLFLKGFGDFRTSRLRRRIYIHARNIRRILHLPASYQSRISNEEVLRRAKTTTLSSRIFLAQCKKLGLILRGPRDHPDYVILFKNRHLDPQIPPGRKPRSGRARNSWFPTLFANIFAPHNYTRTQLPDLAQEPHAWDTLVLHLCSKMPVSSESNYPALRNDAQT